MKRLRDESGQILLIAALSQIVFLVVVGFAVDYGFWLLERQKLQNAVDAASLAGARALVDGATPGVTAARATTLDYLDRHGYRTDADTTVAVTFPIGAGGMIESVAVAVERTRETYFVRLVGVEEVEVDARATAAVDRRMIDIMLSLDLTGSMELSGANHMQNLRDAVEAFADQVNPSIGDPLGPKVGIARFAGVMCQWRRTNTHLSHINLSGVPSIGSEYQAPCVDDKSIVTPLTHSKPLLLRIADNVPGVSCPAGQSPYACPLKSWRYENPTIATGSVAGSAQPAGMMLTSNAGASEICIGSDCDLRPDFTGTKLPNGVTVVANSWSTANGGRNDPAVGVARKVLVMITDGQNELWPSTGHPVGNASVWDAEAVTAANNLKRGLDGITGTADDVEIYTIGFFCEAGSLTGWCQSSLVNQYDAPRPCPGPGLPAQRSTVDNILIQMSSSAPGACDRYFPIAKGENLPLLFQTIAGAITRSRLTQ
jgi:Flp pilus assembly protein TadG